MAEWSVQFCNAEAKAEVDRLSIELRAKFERIVALIKSKGLQHVREPYIKHLEGKLWEMRMMDRDGIARSIYVAAAGRRVMILHTFMKKTTRRRVVLWKSPEFVLEISYEAESDTRGKKFCRMATRPILCQSIQRS